jgi:hypothetical protein
MHFTCILSTSLQVGCRICLMSFYLQKRICFMSWFDYYMCVAVHECEDFKMDLLTKDSHACICAYLCVNVCVYVLRRSDACLPTEPMYACIRVYVYVTCMNVYIVHVCMYA